MQILLFLMLKLQLKHINGFLGAYFLNKEMQLYVLNETDMYFKNVYAKYGHCYNEENFLKATGKGKSMDIGFTIEKKTLQKKYQCPNFCNKMLKLQYSWKFGISLIDIGYIRFKKNAVSYVIDNRTNIWYNFSTMSPKGVDGLDTSLSEHFSFPISSGDKFTMLLPWDISAQFDYNIGYNFYVNATWVQRISYFGLIGIDRANIIAIIPRFDYSRVEVAVPIVFYQYLWPRIGIALRLNNFLIVGTDKVGTFIGNRLSGADIYFSLKNNELNKCKEIKKKDQPSI